MDIKFRRGNNLFLSRLNGLDAFPDAHVDEMWDYIELADHLRDALERWESELQLEQAVRGVDMQGEVAIQARLAQELSAHYTVARESYYPAAEKSRLSHRQRCDLCLVQRSPGIGDARLWLEVKIAYQFREGQLRHRAYSTQWRTSLIRDLKKMGSDPNIEEAALLLVTFNESAEVFEKDLNRFELLLLEQEVLAGTRIVRTFPIQDRIGHGQCGLALWPTINP